MELVLPSTSVFWADRASGYRRGFRSSGCRYFYAVNFFIFAMGRETGLPPVIDPARVIRPTDL